MTTLLRDGRTVDDPRLDRLPSQRTDHLDKYPLTAATLPARKTSMLAGTNWYPEFWEPRQRRIRGRTYHVIGDRPLTRPVGGHAYVLREWTAVDLPAWWAYYDQRMEGRCPEFSALRMLSLHNRKRYDITSRWHYWQMQRIDEWRGGSYPGAYPVYEGSSVRAALEVLRQHGAIPARPRGAAISPDEAPQLVRPEEGIAAYRWADNWGDCRTVCGVPDWMPGIPMLNSWGRDGYPHHTIVLDDVGPRLMSEFGEFGVVVDR